MKLLIRLLIESFWDGTKKITDHRLLTSGIVVVIILGLLGFNKVFPEFSFLTHLFMTLQLFLLDSQSFDSSDVAIGRGETIPWTLDAARWFAAFITFYGVIYAALKFLKVSNDKLRIRSMRKHMVVLGSGEVVHGIMEEALANRKDHALITQCSKTLSEWRAVGLAGLEITNDARIEKENLISAGIQHAAGFYVLGTSDSENLHAALQAAAMDGSCHIVLRQDEPFACDLLQRNPPLPAKCRHSLRVISIEKSRARILINNYPLEWDARSGYANEVHLILPQLGAFQKSVVIQAALVGHYKNGMRVNIWLDSPDCRARLLADFPGIRHCLNLNALGENGIESITSIASRCRNGSLITILADHLTPEEAYIQTIKLREAWPKNLAFRTIISRGPSGIPPFAADHPNLVVAPEMRGLITPENLAKLDSVAKQIHDTWYRGNQRRIDEAIAKGDHGLANQLSAKTTFKDWNELTEEQRDSNRYAADHIEIKFRAVGIDRTHPDLDKAWKNLTHDQIELLSRMEHGRWTAPLWLANYSHGERNDSSRQHPNLIPYDELDQSTKSFDSDQVKMAANYFISSGE
jgi:hypothetical protein